jgi:hypothetical protein
MGILKGFMQALLGKIGKMEPRYVSPYAICPNCKEKLEKPRSLYLMQTLDTDIISISSSSTIPCLYCRYEMLKSDVVDGKFDPPSAPSS